MDDVAVKLVMVCPSSSHLGESRVSGWIHDRCGGDLYLKGDAFIICLKCLSKNHICDWKFACGIHSGKFEKKSPNYNSCMPALGAMSTSCEAGFSNKLDGLKFMAGIQMSIFKKHNNL